MLSAPPSAPDRWPDTTADDLGQRLRDLPRNLPRNLPRDVRDTWFLLAVIAWITLPLATSIPVWATLFAVAALLWRGWLAWSGRPLPRRRWLAALLVAVIVATLLSFHTLIGRESGVALVALLLSLKTLELRARRDAFVVFFLGFFVLLTNFLHSQSIVLAAAMLVGLWGLLTALVNAHRPAGQPRLRDSARTALLLTLAGAPMMVLLFMFFPRFAPLWAMPSNDPAGRTGLSATMDLGAINKLALDEGIALRVRFDGAPPPQGLLYFRGPVLSHFDGRTWSSASLGDFDGLGISGPPDLHTHGEPVRYEVTLEPSQRDWLLAIDATPRPLRIDGDPRRRARLTGELQWLVFRPVTERLRYRAEAYLSYSYGSADRDGHPRADLTRYLMPFLSLPTDRDPRTAQLADQLRQQTRGDARAIVNLALQRLRTGGYQYTLNPGPTTSDSADQFWFDSKAGFCEHIASAFVVLMRGAGVPARIVTGFQGGELNSIDGYWVVRNADAHAWAEVWLTGQGWTRVDPTGAVWPARTGLLQHQWRRLTPPEGLAERAIDAISPTLLTQLRTLWDATNNGWNQWVLNYTRSRQLDLLRALGFATPDMVDLVKVLAGLIVLAALIGAAWAKWERSHRDPWLRLLARARTRLERAGMAVPPLACTTPRALMQCVQTGTQAERQAGNPPPPDWRAPLIGWLLQLEQWRYATPDTASRPRSLSALRRQFRRIALPQ